jgi:transposase
VVLRNAAIILMNAVGGPTASIAYDPRHSARTLETVRQVYRQRGLEGLISGTSTGRVLPATSEHRAALGKVLTTTTQDLCYGFSVWSVAGFNVHMLKGTRVGFGEDQLGRIMKQEGFSFRCPKHTMKRKHDEKAFRTARRKLRALTKRPSQISP